MRWYILTTDILISRIPGIGKCIYIVTTIISVTRHCYRILVVRNLWTIANVLSITDFSSCIYVRRWKLEILWASRERLGCNSCSWYCNWNNVYCSPIPRVFTSIARSGCSLHFSLLLFFIIIINFIYPWLIQQCYQELMLQNAKQ